MPCKLPAPTSILLRSALRPLLASLLLLGLVACGKSENSAEAAATPADTPRVLTAEMPTPTAPATVPAEVAAYYAQHKDFFVEATPADLPADLKWEDGLDLPEIGDPAALKGGVLNLRLQDYPATLRIVGPDSNGGFRPFILDDTRMQFARRHPNVTAVGPTGFSYIAGIAQRWALGSDRKTVYIQLDPAARWSDGQPITTDDVFYTFYFYQSPHLRAPWYTNWYGFGVNYEKLTRFDRLTFAITNKEARPDAKTRGLEMEPMPGHFFGVLGEDFVDKFQWKFVPTSGPYVVRDEDVEKNRSIALTRLSNWWANDRKHWRHRFNFDQIRFSIVRDTPKAFEVFRKGELDYFGLNLAEYYYDKLPNDAEPVQRGYIGKYTFYNDRPRPTYGLWINSGRPLLNQPEVRVGIAYATDFDTVCQKFYRGDASRMRTASDGYGDFSHPTLKARPYDPEQALAAFARAGFTKRGADGILVNEGGERLSFQLSTGYEALKDVMTILKEQAAVAGLEFRVEVLDGTTGWKKVQEKQHEIFFSAFAVSAEMYPRYWETFHSSNAYDQAFLADGSLNPARQPKPQTNNLTMTADRKLDALIERYDNSESIPEMQGLVREIEELLQADAAFVPGFVNPFFRVATWNWIQWPRDFNVKLAESADQWHLAWFDPEARTRIRAAMRAREAAGEPVVKVFDQYAPPTSK